MTDQEKEQEKTISEAGATEESPEESPAPEQHARFKETTESLKETTENLVETTEKIWGSTKQAWNTATFKAVQYKKLVQIKIDQSALHKKINAAHTDLGKMIDDLREAGKKSIMSLSEVKEILKRIDELKAASATLEEEVEKIKSDGPPQEEAQEETQEEETK
jgi:hypothetical protein